MLISVEFSNRIIESQSEYRDRTECTIKDWVSYYRSLLPRITFISEVRGTGLSLLTTICPVFMIVNRRWVVDLHEWAVRCGRKM